MVTTEEILKRIDSVLKQNRLIECVYIMFTSILFLSGIGCIIIAIALKEFTWSIPSAFTTFFLRWPLIEIRGLRRKNIALATIPILIDKLPEREAAQEIQKLIQNLYKENE